MRRCATCYRDPAIAHWKDPDKVRPRGTSESNWICNACRAKPHNRGWIGTPAEELYGREGEDEDDVNAVPDSEPGPFETPLCIEIMRRFCMRQSRRKIARELQTGEGHVRRTISHWKANHAHFLEELMNYIGRIN